MAILEKVYDALRVQDLPPDLPVLKVSAEEYTDSTGEEALRVSVLLPEDLPDSALTGDAVSKLKMAIHDRLIARGISLFPYVWLMKPSDLLPEPEKRRNARRSN